jgi:hypothetical protein
MLTRLFLALGFLAAAPPPAAAQAGVDGVIPRAKARIVMDGRLDEWSGAFATPVNFGHADWENRAAVWRYLWDDRNLYIGLEWLDTKLFNADPGGIYNGDAVEFYIDVREHPGGAQWTKETLHLHYTAASNDQVKPRIQVRPGIPAFAGITAAGMEAAAAKTERGYAMEFRLPWSKFPDFKPAAGRVIGIDCELCSSDGGPRVDRCWVYSGPAAVQTPSAFGRMRLVDDWDPAEAAAFSDALFPAFLARASPSGEPATLFLAIAPPLEPLVRKVEMSAGGRRLTFVVIKQFGPGWTRAQACLVGFLQSQDPSVEVRFLGEEDRVLGTRSVPLR